MSTQTATTRTTPATSSWASSTKFKTFAITFAIVGPVIYMICLQMNWPLLEGARSGEGPNMTWYCWAAMPPLVATVVSFLATLFPESAARRIPLILVWLLPILAIPYLIYDLRQWWFHP